MRTNQPRPTVGDHVDAAAEGQPLRELARPSAAPGPARRARRPSANGVALGFRRALLALVTVAPLAGAVIAAYSVLSGNWTISPILSGSMRPGFPVGGVVVAERIPTSDLAVGDVIIFQDPNHPSEQVVHRIVQLDFGQSAQPVIKTKGDANAAEDPWTISLQGTRVYAAQFTLPLLGYAAVNTNRGIDLVIGGAILLLVAISTLLSHGTRPANEKATIDCKTPARAGPATSGPDDGIRA